MKKFAENPLSWVRSFGVCPLVTCAAKACTGGAGAGASRSENLLKGVMKANASSKAQSEAPPQAQEVGHQQHPGPENKESAHA